jgi:hypothetical protein
VLRALSGLKRKMFCTLLIVGLLVPALPMAAFATQGDIPGNSEESIAWNLAQDEGVVSRPCSPQQLQRVSRMSLTIVSSDR